jgi:hypothetical protein
LAAVRVSPITIRRSIASGQLAAERVGRGIRVRPEATEDFIAPIVPNADGHVVDARDKRPSIGESRSTSIGVRRSGEPTRAAEHEDNVMADSFPVANPHEDDENLVEVYSASSSDGVEFIPDELLGKTFSFDDPLWNFVGIGQTADSVDAGGDEDKEEMPSLRE